MDMGDILDQWDKYQAAQIKKQKESGSRFQKPLSFRFIIC